MVQRFLSLGLLLLATARLGAYQVTYAKTGHTVTSGMDYAIHYEIKQLIARHEQVFRRKAPTDFKITYRIYPTYEEYRDYAASQNFPVNPRVLGYTGSEKSFRPGTGEITGAQAEVVTWKHPQPAVLLATVLHETTHAVTQAFLLHVPLWMNEGSADWFGKPAWADGETQKLDRARRWQTLKRLLDEGKLPPIRPYLEVGSYEGWGKLFNGDIGMGYVVGWSLFDFFMSHPNAQNFLAALLKAPAVERGARPEQVFSAQLAALWRGGLPVFEQGWHNWIRTKAEQEKVPSAQPKTK